MLEDVKIQVGATTYALEHVLSSREEKFIEEDQEETLLSNISNALIPIALETEEDCLEN